METTTSDVIYFYDFSDDLTSQRESDEIFTQILEIFRDDFDENSEWNVRDVA